MTYSKSLVCKSCQSELDRIDFIEAKSSGARGYVRTAIGQVLDYRHLLSKQGCEYSPAVLLPFLPSEDLVSLLDSIGITLIVQDSSGFKYYRPHAS